MKRVSASGFAVGLPDPDARIPPWVSVRWHPPGASSCLAALHYRGQDVGILVPSDEINRRSSRPRLTSIATNAGAARGRGRSRPSHDAERFIEQVGFAACLTDSRRPGPSLYVAVCGRRDAVMPRNVQKDPEASLHLAAQGRHRPARQGLLRQARPRQGDVRGAAHDPVLSRGLGHAARRRRSSA